VLAYKFRGAEQFHLGLDIIFNQRLYCADWAMLNDPMEGLFVFSASPGSDGRGPSGVEQISSEKKRYRVCSLSKTFDCHLLWAHYASGFSGMAIEVDLPQGAPDVYDVSYRGVYACLNQEECLDPEQAAKAVLTSKYKEWEYEQEVRILLNSWQQPGDQYYTLNQPVTRVIAGQRMTPALLQALKIICKDRGIKLCTVGIGDEGIDADPCDL
jgi:hypothetical protein